MAKTEHQGLQISLILFVMVTVVLAITTFVYYRQSEESAKAADDAKKKMEAATTRRMNTCRGLTMCCTFLGRRPWPKRKSSNLNRASEAMRK